jgi:hypothetical protein
MQSVRAKITDQRQETKSTYKTSGIITIHELQIGYWLDGLICKPDKGKKIFYSPKTFKQALSPTQSPVQRVPKTSSHVMYMWSYNSTTLIPRHGLYI